MELSSSRKTPKGKRKGKEEKSSERAVATTATKELITVDLEEEEAEMTG